LSHEETPGTTPASASPTQASWPVGVALALFTVWSALFIAETVVTTYDGRRVFCLFDDAMVSMRYSWNLAHGNGLVWNPGERVEGYTNLGHTLSMAVFILLLGKFNAVAAIQVMGMIAVAVSAVLGMRIAEHLSRENGIEVTAFWQVVYLTVSLAYYPLSYWSLMGMETGPLAALLAGTALSALRAPEDRVSWPLVVLSATAFLVRPDALVTVGVIFLFRLAALPRNRRALRVILAEVGTISGVVIAASMFRLLYYGSWVPNTYTLKVSGYSLGFRIANGWAFDLFDVLFRNAHPARGRRAPSPRAGSWLWLRARPSPPAWPRKKPSGAEQFSQRLCCCRLP
jgi:hypothetical protein